MIDFNNLPPQKQVEHLMRENGQLQQLLQMRSTIMFGQMLDALNIRIQQALAGQKDAQSECRMLAQALDKLEPASMGIHLTT